MEDLAKFHSDLDSRLEICRMFKHAKDRKVFKVSWCFQGRFRMFKAFEAKGLGFRLV